MLLSVGKKRPPVKEDEYEVEDIVAYQCKDDTVGLGASHPPCWLIQRDGLNSFLRLSVCALPGFVQSPMEGIPA